MGSHTHKKWITITLAAIVIPLSLLTAFKITGIIPEPQQPEMVSRDPVTWEINKPSKYVVIDDQIENPYIDNETALIFRVHLCSYREDSPDSPFDGKDGLVFKVSVNASVIKGFVSSFEIKFQPDIGSIIFVSRYSFLENINATVREMRDLGTHFNEAYLKASASESSSYLKTQTYWVFADDNSTKHQMSLTLEVIYFNGNGYKKVITPIILQVLAPTQGSEG